MREIPARFVPFDSWPDVCAYVANRRAVYYMAPLDRRPVLVDAEPRRGAIVRVFPPSRDVDPFSADASHVDRFFRRVDDPAVPAPVAPRRAVDVLGPVLTHEIRPLWHHDAGLDYTRSGYGSQIPTRHVVTFVRDPRRRRRVYVTIFGNSGSLWVSYGRGRRLYLADHEIPDPVDSAR